MVNKNIPAVLGIGNALVDVISVIKDDSLLQKFNLPRGSMTLVNAERSQQIYAATFSESSKLTTGGSVANTMRSLANMGGNGGYMGKVGRDKLGDLFKDDFERRGLRTHLTYSESGTGRVMALVSPDSERTMATYLGAASELQAYDYMPGLFNGYKYLYMEGYLVFNHDLIKAGVEKAKAAGLKVAIDLSSFNVVDANLEFLKDLIKNNVDIVIANEEEARSFTGLEPEAALHEIAKDCELAIVKVGKEGSLIKHGDVVTRIGIVPAKALDTTGAGDAYAAGFFYGLTNGYSMAVSGKIAALVSGKVVEVMGPNLPDHQWPEVMAEINKIVAED
ncbi:adenosine kinase [Maribellus luteus]|uniref:Adenosine kinase n=1 Tax=Maribellus luteus TaxID=2305463 RepID=A0A399SQA1_9BACT|nr:adenosine kinase [Maribellus luteus]RIJ45538.1 adenosine kinase [Maribellus luteus]